MAEPDITLTFDTAPKGIEKKIERRPSSEAQYRLVAVPISDCKLFGEIAHIDVGSAWIRSKGHSVELQLDLTRVQSKFLVLRMITSGDHIEQ